MSHEKIQYQSKTKYGTICVRDSFEGDSALRTLFVNDRPESSMYLATDSRSELIFNYMKYFSFAVSMRPEIRKTLLIGGGGFAYPRHYLANYPEKSITVAEISPDIIKLSRRYFDLDKLEAQSDRFRLVEGDGFEWLRNSDETFDLIINDAFLGAKSIGRAGSDTEIVASHLAPGGIYMVNEITAVRGLRSIGGKRYMRAVTKVLPHANMIAVNQGEEWFDPRERQNCLLVASNEPI